ncbi:MAG TPA: Gfo/Idh/MocA family oxidoreductase [Anaerolineae bacterium]|nr:Gfo/Idh/MocA family oxidoreductase [Anaerolineae bacterium]HQK13461.1 Gfo/Idh/MocA family oxidoreductase [Anaerolineae bacterium]
MKEVTVAMVALGGYGNSYLAELFTLAAEHNARFVAGIDPNPVGCRHLEAFKETGVPIYPDLDSFYAESWADLVVLSPPIHLHLPFTLKALAHGSHVLCEKPVTATVQDAWRMAEAARASGKLVGIGYQWSYSAAIQALKRDIMDGVLGRPLRLRTKVFWPRGSAYYGRNTWAAKLKGPNGEWILDSPAHNATAHYLHNCFYILGDTRETSAWPVDVQAELYRANPIENYDTAAIRCHTADGVEILFYTTHAVPNNIGPIFSYEFENAVVTYAAYSESMPVYFHDGSVKDYGNPYADQIGKLWQAVDAVRTGEPLACSVEGAIPEVLCINGAQESMWEIAEFPKNLIRCRDHQGDGPGSDRPGDRLTWVEGLQEALELCFDRGLLPSEVGFPWAKSGALIDLRDYREFPMFH